MNGKYRTKCSMTEINTWAHSEVGVAVERINEHENVSEFTQPEQQRHRLKNKSKSLTDLKDNNRNLQIISLRGRREESAAKRLLE